MRDSCPVVLITGGGQGIGRAVALDYARNNYRVAIGDIDVEAGKETQEDIISSGRTSIFVPTDVSSAEDMKKLFEQIEGSFGRLDLIISNAGIGGDLFGTPVEALEVEAFDRVINVNLRGAFLCAKYGVPLLKRQGGSIIIIASTRGMMSEVHTEPYSASKGGLLALTHSLAVSLSGSGIRVNAISPGWISTESWQKSSRRREPAFTEADCRQHPVGRVGDPDDIAAACRFLSSSGAGFITGINLVVDGGMTVKMIYE